MDLVKLLVSAGNYLTLCAFLAFISCLLIKEFKGALYAGVTTLFFFIGVSYYPYLAAWDSEGLYRYPIWIFHDTLWMGLIAYLGLNDKISWRQSVLGQLFCLPLLIVNFFRAMDVQFIQLYVSTGFYRVIYPVCETAIILLCWVPIFLHFKNKYFTKTQTA